MKAGRVKYQESDSGSNRLIQPLKIYATLKGLGWIRTGWTRKPVAGVLCGVFMAVLAPCCHGFQGDEIPVPVVAETPAATMMNMMFGGSLAGTVVVALILVLSIVCLFSIADHFMAITRRRILPDGVMDELERLVLHGELQRAMHLCREKNNYSLATELVLAGLERFHNSEFGFAEYRAAVEEAGEDLSGRLYRRTELLNVIGSVAPMLGLLGTVLGMIEAFTTIASRRGMATPQELAGGIGDALITTLLGLIVAIPAMVALSYFRARIDSLIAESGKRIERILAPLGRRRPGPGNNPGGAVRETGG